MRARGVKARSKASAPKREQGESAFSRILADLVLRVPGARGAALVDRDGETVDDAARSDSFGMRVAAAHWRIVLAELQASGALGDPSSFAVRTARASFVVRALPDRYALILWCGRTFGPEHHERALSACLHGLAVEAGWKGVRAAPWYAVEVVRDDGGHPIALQTEAKEQPLDVIGRYRQSLGWRERAWRVRSAAGVEAMLVREPGGFWYADEPLLERRPSAAGTHPHKS